MSGAVQTATGPGTSMASNFNAKTRDVTPGESMEAGLLVTPSVGTYGNGVALCGAQHGSDNDAEAGIEQIEVMGHHPRSNVAYDKSTDFEAGDHAIAIKHEIGKEYWLKGSSLTAIFGAKLITASSGLIAVAGDHASTPLSMHTYECTLAVSGGVWTKGVYKGLTLINTTT